MTRWLVALIVLCCAREATAKDHEVRLIYSAPASCPDRLFFFDALISRAPSIRVLDPSEEPNAEVIVTASITTSKGSLHGILLLEEQKRPYPLRHVTGQTCSEVANALALIAALAITARPQVEKPLVVTTTTATEEPAEPMVPGSVTTVLVEHAPWAWSVGAQGWAAHGMLPADFVFAPSVFIDLRHRSRADLLSPSFRIAVAGSTQVTNVAAMGEVDFGWVMAEVQGCPVRSSGASTNMEACAGLQVGTITGSGHTVRNPTTGRELWLAFGALVRFQWFFVDPLFVEAEAGIFAPLIRPRFYLARSTVIYEVSGFTGHFGAGLGVSFW